MKKYKIIYADPPWQYKVYSEKGKGRSAENHYPTMSIEDICKLPIKDLADESNIFSDEVEKVVAEMCEKVEASAQSIAESVEDTDKSLASLEQLRESFTRLTDNFEKIYLSSDLKKTKRTIY